MSRPAALRAALAEVGRIIESMPPSERGLEVAQFVASMSEADQRTFLVGVFIWAHEQDGCEKRVYRTVYRRRRDLDRHPGIDPARLPLTVYSSSENLNFQRDDLTYLRTDEQEGVAEAWIETRIEHPWERTDD